MNFDFLFTAFGTVLATLYDLRNSYAFMIIGLTLVVMVVLTPLTLKATRSMLMMQQLQPEMKKIQSRYKDDRQKLNEELLKFYKENNINPVGGCLPLLVQTPVFLVLYSVLRGLTLRVPVMGSNIGHVAGQRITGAGVTNPPDILHLHTFAPNYLPTDSALYRSLHGTTEMSSLGLDLSRGANDIIGTSIVSAIPYLLLIALVAVTGVVQQRQIQARSSGAAINPQQQAIMKFMPFFLPIFSFAIPSGLVLYFVVSNTYRVGQQWFISRNIYAKHEPVAEAEDDDPPAYDGGGISSGGIVGWLERFTGQGGGRPAADEKPAGKVSTSKASTGKVSTSKSSTGKVPAGKVSTAKGAGGKAQPAKEPAKSSAGKTSGSAARTSGAGAKTGRTSGRTTPSKSASAGSRNGAGNPKAGTRTTNAPGSGGRAASAKKGTGSEPGSSSSSADRPPTLQPRARKNKKR